MKIYRCNPDKNKECRKTYCYINGGPCISTSNPKKAIRNSDGTPRETADLENYLLMEQWIREQNITEEQLEEFKEQALRRKLEEESEDEC